MTASALHEYLRTARESMLWKLEGVGEYDIRRPLTPTGTNLLGLVKHLATIEFGYFGLVFGRPATEPLPWTAEDADPNDDLWATADESREWVTGLYRRAWAHADATIDELEPHAVGRVPWWPPERTEVTLHRILVHVVAETNRHLGHADILREGLDGSVGSRPDRDNMAPGDQEYWTAHLTRLEEAARRASAG
ncbi:DinB family protein [Pseudonocardia eucalypti]|uniref:DinB family protein n=1 Tax=Pseudonocardia eucalypti TaxID=648755 RepID=A0ABP9PXP8_9PSEU|nr:hypothetical protein [Pseudonocardia eucalypti]